jgi:hypothetical protein
MSLPFDQIPDSVWNALCWFASGGVVGQRPDTATVRAAYGLGLLSGNAIPWVRRPDPTHWSKVLVTNLGLAALMWWAERPMEVETDSANPPDPWADFRDGPGGSLLTPKECWERFGVSGSVLSKDPEAKRTRRKNPAGRGFVYRYDVVARIANRKPFDDE